MPVCFCAAIACKEAMRALMLLFKGFASDLVTLQRWQFQLAAFNGFVNKLVKAQAQSVHALDWVRIKDNVPPIVSNCAVLQARQAAA